MPCQEANSDAIHNLHETNSDDDECSSLCTGTSSGSESNDDKSSLYLSENSDLSSDAESCQDINSHASEIDTMPSVDHTVNVGLLSIMDKHSLSYACVGDMLKLMSASVPNFVSSSLHVLLNEFVQPKESMRVHRCCGSCTKLLEPETTCNMPECIAQGLPISSFIEVRLDYQLQLLFTGKSQDLQ